MKAILAALLALGLAGPALAQPMHPAEAPVPGQGGSAPGGLTAEQVKGKFLLNANGKELGIISGVSADGEEAIVRTPDGRRITAKMKRLSLGNGPNTVIEAGNSEADRLNRLQMAH